MPYLNKQAGSNDNDDDDGKPSKDDLFSNNESEISTKGQDTENVVKK
jgi:hypothetical protein